MRGRLRPGSLVRSGASRIVVIVLVIVGVAVALFPAHTQGLLHMAGYPLADLIAIPMERMAVMDRSIREWWTQRGAELQEIREQNRELRRSVERLEGEVNQWRERMLASGRLSELLEFRKRAPVRTTAAMIIGRNASNWYQGVVLNKGADDGIRAEMGVMTPAGVVGQIVKTGRSTSIALLMIDPNVVMGGLVQRTRDEGVVQGTSQGHVRMKYIPPLSSIKEGDVVITSGLTGGFPKGMLIGRVSHVEEGESDLFQVAAIVPAVHFRQLEEVLIVLAPHPSEVAIPLETAGKAPVSRNAAP